MSEQPNVSQLENIYADVDRSFLKDDPSEYDPNLFDRMNQEDGKQAPAHGTLSGLKAEVNETFPTPETDGQRVAQIAAFTRAIPAYRFDRIHSKDGLAFSA